MSGVRVCCGSLRFGVFGPVFGPISAGFAPIQPEFRPARGCLGARLSGGFEVAAVLLAKRERTLTSTGAQEGKDGEHPPVILRRLAQVELEEDLRDVGVDGLPGQEELLGDRAV